jgi:hypothetical protein
VLYGSASRVLDRVPKATTCEVARWQAGLMSDCLVRRFIARDYRIANDCDAHRMPAPGASTLAVDVV